MATKPAVVNKVGEAKNQEAPTIKVSAPLIAVVPLSPPITQPGPIDMTGTDPEPEAQSPQNSAPPVPERPKAVRVMTCLPRRNGSPVRVDKREYVFVPHDSGHYIAAVLEQDAKVLLQHSIYWRFGDPQPAAQATGLGFRNTPEILAADEADGHDDEPPKDPMDSNPFMQYEEDELRAIYEANLKQSPGTFSKRAMANQLAKAGISAPKAA